MSSIIMFVTNTFKSQNPPGALTQISDSPSSPLKDFCTTNIVLNILTIASVCWKMSKIELLIASATIHFLVASTSMSLSSALLHAAPVTVVHQKSTPTILSQQFERSVRRR